MKKIEAGVQHVSIFRIGSSYLFGVLYDFESDDQEGSLDVIIQGNTVSFGINEASGPKSGRTAMATVVVNILSLTGPIQAFDVNKGGGSKIVVPVFSLKGQDQLKVFGELSSNFSVAQQTLSVVPKSTSGLPADIVSALGVEEGRVSPARDWGWRGW